MYKELAIDALILSTQWGMDFTFFPLPSNFSIAPKQSLLYNVKFGSKIYIECFQMRKSCGKDL